MAHSLTPELFEADCAREEIQGRLVDLTSDERETIHLRNMEKAVRRLGRDLGYVPHPEQVYQLLVKQGVRVASVEEATSAIYYAKGVVL